MLLPPSANFPTEPSLYLGRVAWVADRGALTLTRYDARGRVTGVARQLAKPDAVSTTLATRYAAEWYIRKANFDAADRPVRETTGAKVTQMLGAAVAEMSEGSSPSAAAPDNTSVVTTTYTQRGTVASVTGSYGVLVDHVIRDADGLVTEIQYGDGAKTTTGMTYDERRRLKSVTTYRGVFDKWTTPPSNYVLAPAYPGSTPTTFQLLLQDEDYAYDEVDNPVEIRDWRIADEWPAGAKPVTRAVQYDDETAAACQIKPGRLSDGMPCTVNDQCESTSCRKEAYDAPCGICGARSGVGQACDLGLDCQSGLLCNYSNANSICVVGADVGASCDDERPCKGAFTCVDGMCVNSVGAGAVCGPDSAPCQSSLGLVCNPDTGRCETCTTNLQAGQECGSATELCAAGECLSSWHDPSSTGDTCVAFGIEGDVCGESKHPTCQSGLECVTGTCVPLSFPECK